MAKCVFSSGLHQLKGFLGLGMSAGDQPAVVQAGAGEGVQEGGFGLLLPDQVQGVARMRRAFS